MRQAFDDPGQHSQVRFESEARAGLRRPTKLANLNITATTSGAAQTVYTVPAKTFFEIKSLTVCNNASSAVTINLHEVESGGSIGAGNRLLGAYSVGANSTISLPLGPTSTANGSLWDADATIKVWASTNGDLTLHGWGEEIRG